MKVKPIFIAVPAMVALLTGCTWDSPLTPVWPAAASSSVSAQTNGEIIQDLMVLNKSEVAAANLAIMKSNCPRTKRFAQYLKMQHTKGLRQIEHLSHQTGIAPVMNSVATNLDMHSKQELAELGLLTQSAFNRAFVADMVSDHEAGLKLIDQSLKNATNPKLIRLLKATRHHVAMHLRKAEALQKAMAQ